MLCAAYNSDASHHVANGTCSAENPASRPERESADIDRALGSNAEGDFEFGTRSAD